MTLNKFMHPKNVYKKKQPSFKDLAIKYEEFRRHTTQDEAGKVHIDFKDAKALKALTWALLKDDFGLDVDLPLDRLVPTVPLRLNYLLWLADLMGKKKSVHGIDIGCGASCVYPLLGAKTNQWSFIATEADDMNFQYAKRNVEKNDLGDKINIVKVENNGDIFGGLESEKKYDFTMCNPPFFASNLEAYAMTKTRNSDRSEPNSICTASEAESITPGGEVEFVRKMIEESRKLKNQIRVFTTMLGKKSSLGVLKEELRKADIKNVGSYEFCQGRTMRWGLGWSYDTKVRFPRSPFQHSKIPEKGPLVYNIDRNIKGSKYEIQPLGAWLVKLLEEVSVKYAVIMDCEAMWSATVTAHENTWSHQRRKRRADRRAESSVACKRLSPGPDLTADINYNTKSLEGLESTGSEKVSVNGSSEDENDVLASAEGDTEQTQTRLEGGQTETETPATDDEPLPPVPSDEPLPPVPSDEPLPPVPSDDPLPPVPSDDPLPPVPSDDTLPPVPSDDTLPPVPSDDTLPPVASDDACIVESHSKCKSTSDNAVKGETSKHERPVLFSAWFTFKLDDDENIYLELKWLKGKDREAMQQVLQLIKNRLRSSNG